MTRAPGQFHQMALIITIDDGGREIFQAKLSFRLINGGVIWTRQRQRADKRKSLI